MKLIKTKIKGAFIVLDQFKEDSRGAFCKFYNDEKFKLKNLNFQSKEIYYNISNKNVIRGMHFQIPPYDHSKLIKCIYGEILDVILDIRKESSTYLKYDTINLKENDGKSIYLPSGVAHGFLSLKEKTMVLYNVSSIYSPDHDKGILWNSFGLKWPCSSPIISKRDQNFERINLFKTPFL